MKQFKTTCVSRQPSNRQTEPSDVFTKADISAPYTQAIIRHTDTQNKVRFSSLLSIGKR